LTYEKGHTFAPFIQDEHYVRDLDGDGVAEIISTYDATYCMAECGAASRATRLIFCRVGARYRDCTRKFSDLVGSQIRQIESGPDGGWDRWYRAYDIYANALMIGREAEALAWLKAHTPADDYRIFMKDLPKIRASVAARKQRIRWFATRGSMGSSHSSALR
jgi:hypothetical protein